MADDFMRLLALWVLVHETADEGWKAAVERGGTAGPGGMDGGPDAFVDGLAAMVAEEKERLKAELASGAVEAPARAGRRRDALDELRFEVAELRGRIEALQATLDALRATSESDGAEGSRPWRAAADRRASARRGRDRRASRRASASRPRTAAPRGVARRVAALAFEELGPAFIKLGQLVSVRPDVFSRELVFEMEQLQDPVPPLPAAASAR